MTLQQLYTKVRNHLLTQNAKATEIIHGQAVCRYRTPEGLKCAVGCLIPDSNYTPSLEGKTVSTEVVAKAAGLPWTGFINKGSLLNLASRLQNIHDLTLVPSWKQNLNALAKELDLRVEE